jgi:Arc/MetJ-type ribon-helix-helix transcriptional regulator
MDIFDAGQYTSNGIIPNATESNMAKTRRVVFSFDERSLESLQKLTDQGRFNSMADTVRESLQVSRALQLQAGQGFSEVIVRNPETNEERVLVIPNLTPGGAKPQG